MILYNPFSAGVSSNLKRFLRDVPPDDAVIWLFSAVIRLKIAFSASFSIAWKEAWWPHPSHSNEEDTFKIGYSSSRSRLVCTIWWVKKRVYFCRVKHKSETRAFGQHRGFIVARAAWWDIWHLRPDVILGTHNRRLGIHAALSRTLFAITNISPNAISRKVDISINPV